MAHRYPPTDLTNRATISSATPDEIVFYAHIRDPDLTANATKRPIAKHRQLTSARDLGTYITLSLESRQKAGNHPAHQRITRDFSRMRTSYLTQHTINVPTLLNGNRNRMAVGRSAVRRQTACAPCLHLQSRAHWVRVSNSYPEQALVEPLPALDFSVLHTRSLPHAG